MAKYSVRKANYLINLEEKMSKAAQLWVSYLIACLPRSVDDLDEFPSLTFTFREVKRAINADGKRRVTDSRELKSIHKELIRTPLWYEDEKKGRWVAWLTEVEWDKEVDNFTYYFHPKLKPYLVNVKEHFTIYNYYYRVCLSPHGMKLYEILKSYQYQGAVVLDIEEDIKPSLGLAHKYKKYYDFRRRVLDPVQEEISQFTDICFEYDEAEKEGKRVLALRFIIKQNTPTNLPRPLLEALQKTGTRIQNSNSNKMEQLKIKYADIFAVLEPWGGNEETITGLIHEYGLEKIQYYINYTRRQQKAGRIKGSAFGYFRRGLEEGWKDKLQDNQQAKAQRRERNKQAGDKVLALKEERTDLLNAYYQEIRERCDQLIAEDSGLLERCMQAIHRNERKRASLNRLIEVDPQRRIYSLEQWYNDHLGHALMAKEIQKLFPRPFGDIAASYRQKVEQVDTQLRALGEQPNTIDWGIDEKEQPLPHPTPKKTPRTGQISNLGELVQAAIPNRKQKQAEFSEDLFDQWKNAFPDVYQSMYKSYISQYQQLLGNDFELSKYQRSIQLKILFDVKDMYESGEWQPA